MFSLWGNTFLRYYSRKAIKKVRKAITAKQEKQSSKAVLKHFAKEPHLIRIKHLIPITYFTKLRAAPQHLYLVDEEIAKDAVDKMLPYLLRKAGIICETNAGLGLITSQMLSQGVQFVRLYETCDEFRAVLMKSFESCLIKVAFFNKDIFHMSILSYQDKCDHGNRIEALLRGVPKIRWTDHPIMTVIGPMPNYLFIRHVLKMVAYQAEIATYGRIQLFTFMKPKHYKKLTSKPEDGVLWYQSISILFQLFCEWNLLEKYPRCSFLPWETLKKTRLKTVDDDYMYLVQINFKKILPIGMKDILHLHYFILQAFGRGRAKVIPTLEKWFPGIGVKLLVPENRTARIFKHIDIYTEFGQLNPEQILQIFFLVTEQRSYKTSPFVALVDSIVYRAEAMIDSDISEKSK